MAAKNVENPLIIFLRKANSGYLERGHAEKFC
jgi:hypothetical protein